MYSCDCALLESVNTLRSSASLEDTVFYISMQPIQPSTSLPAPFTINVTLVHKFQPTPFTNITPVANITPAHSQMLPQLFFQDLSGLFNSQVHNNAVSNPSPRYCHCMCYMVVMIKHVDCCSRLAHSMICRKHMVLTTRKQGPVLVSFDID